MPADFTYAAAGEFIAIMPETPAAVIAWGETRGHRMSTTTPPALPACTCDACEGSGDLTCNHCGGTGTRYPERAGGMICQTCRGHGIVECRECEGSGEVPAAESEAGE